MREKMQRMARQQTNKIIRMEKNYSKEEGEQSTRDTFPLLSCSFFHLVYFCLFCLFLHLRDLVSCVLSKGPGGGWAGMGGGGGCLPGGRIISVCISVCVCPCLCNYIPRFSTEVGWAIIGLTMWEMFDILILLLSLLLCIVHFFLFLGRNSG